MFHNAKVQEASNSHLKTNTSYVHGASPSAERISGQNAAVLSVLVISNHRISLATAIMGQCRGKVLRKEWFHQFSHGKNQRTVH